LASGSVSSSSVSFPKSIHVSWCISLSICTYHSHDHPWYSMPLT
jgi:hypothetical protein